MRLQLVAIASALLLVGACVQCKDDACAGGLQIGVTRAGDAPFAAGTYTLEVVADDVTWTATCPVGADTEERCTIEPSAMQNDALLVIDAGPSSFEIDVERRNEVDRGTDVTGPDRAELRIEVDGTEIAAAQLEPEYERADTNEHRQCGVCRSAGEALVVD